MGVLGPQWMGFVAAAFESNHVVQTLRHWQQDTDLAGIRDAAALAKLPQDAQGE
jgi:hypothetical protein